MLEPPPLSLYVHIPWCIKKCPYCDFNSHAAGGTLPERDYLSSLIADLQRDAHLAQGRKLNTVFFGGGTPSLFSPKAIAEIISAAAGEIGLAENAEITLEANPGTFEQQKFFGFRASGVNRLSIGVQSFNQTQLTALGRVHSGEEASLAVNIARQAGFTNINLDLMHGLPAQTLAQALTDLQHALALAPTHLSWYQLTIEPNTAFYSAPPPLPLEDDLIAIQQRGLAALENGGFAQYEISAFARPGFEAQHNVNYWQFGDYLGIGAGAHSKITLADKGQIIRTNKTRLPRDYMARRPDFVAGRRTLTKDELPQEFLMNALRLHAGVDPQLFTARTGLPLTSLNETWQKLAAEGLVQPSTNQLVATPLGQRFLDTVLSRF